MNEAFKSLPAEARDALQGMEVRLGDLHAELKELKEQLTASKAEVAELRTRLAQGRKQFARVEQELDAARSKLDVEESLFSALEQYRASPEYLNAYRQPHPLVSVCVATYNRSKLLVERCLPSVFAQDYPNLEIIVVGDGCTDDTSEAVQRIRDPRLRFVNRPERAKYPDDPYLRWLVAGTEAGNHAMSLAQGELLTHLDDDDEYARDRIRKLVEFLQETKSELVWHPFWSETQTRQWEERMAEEFRIGQATTGSVLYLSWLKRLPWNTKAYQYREPGDWNLFRKLKYLGVRMKRYPQPLLWHYRQHSHDLPQSDTRTATARSRGACRDAEVAPPPGYAPAGGA